MHAGKLVFAQLMEFVPGRRFETCVGRYGGDHKLKTLPCSEHLRVMAFAQLTYRESLRDIETCLRAVPSKWYHLGLRGGVSRNNWSNANAHRDWRIYADFAQILIAEARVLYAKKDLGLDLDATVYALDATTIDLCLSLFPWARFRRAKGAVKLHTLLNLQGNIPGFTLISPRKTARCERAGLLDSGSRRLLRYGPRLPRLCPLVPASLGQSVLRHSGERKSHVSTAVLPRRCPFGDEQFARIAAARRQRSVPVLARVKAWLDAEQEVVLPRSPMGQAITYSQNQWAALTTYTTQGFLAIDNNASERALKRVAIGRKNWLFAGNDAATENHARFWSLLASAERHAVDPQRYLISVLAKIGTTPADELEQFLTDVWKRDEMAEPVPGK